MTKEACLEKLTNIEERFEDDAEVLHISADTILVEFVRELGYTEIADLYDKLSNDFWYA